MTDMERMFSALENSLKSEMTKLHKDMGHMLVRVEEVEKRADAHTKRIKELKGEIKTLKQEQLEQAYRLEDQLNKEKRKNVRIRGVPEAPQTENIIEVIGQVLNLSSINEARNELKIERAYRTRRPIGLSNETPRDIIVRFCSLEGKNLVWKSLKEKPPILLEGKEIQVFQDLYFNITGVFQHA